MLEVKITQLSLKNFRNHSLIKIKVNPNQNIIGLIDENGKGKTNVLEAISLLSGSGMRGYDLQGMLKSGESSFLISIILSVGGVETKLDIFYENGKKKILINDKQSNNKDDLKNYVNILYITPELQLEISSIASERRKFYDKVVSNFHSSHNKTILDYERLIKERMKILENSHSINSNTWLDSIEKQIAILSINIVQNRNDVLSKINYSVKESNLDINTEISCNVDNLIKQNGVLSQTFIAAQLLENREYDKKSFRTSFGVHRYDLIISYPQKNMQIDFCSSGEKKYLIVSLLIAIAQSLTNSKNHIPIILIDELTSFVDDKLRGILLDKLTNLKCQIWFTGTYLPDLKHYIMQYKIDDLLI